jgi:uncharacterized membrane protein YadS
MSNQSANILEMVRVVLLLVIITILIWIAEEIKKLRESLQPPKQSTGG